ncbi:hypothetical protein J437_LFUL000950 [Ladona fulva]|uniref:Peptidase aspartic putative domain-containing protein n=1 Tax=Ladona fulva TaxID=123851 RepID=A0A8K0P1U8_LADFU|nr:hypothetical protein J437_LFUL000950 [Ladona fulva]
MVDSGSQVSAISSAAVRRLNLPVSPCHGSLFGLSQTPLRRPEGCVVLSLSPLHSSSPVLNTKAVVLPHLTYKLPPVPLPSFIRSSVSHIYMADPEFDKPDSVDLILGVDLLPKIFLGEGGGRKAFEDCNLVLLDSIFGWILMGSIVDSFLGVPPCEASLCVVEELPLVTRTDSNIVLSWLNTPAYKLKIFVANRVSMINDYFPCSIRHYINSVQDPADCASRGIFPRQLPDTTLFWKEPDFLELSEDQWPVENVWKLNLSLLPELKPVNSMMGLVQQENFLIWMDRFSSYVKLVRSFAYVLRFIASIKGEPRQNNFVISGFKL